MAQLSNSEWQKANAKARARERRERDVHYLLAMAKTSHRDAGIQFENMDLVGGVPVGRLRFRVEVDSILFYRVLHELRQRKGWE